MSDENAIVSKGITVFSFSTPGHRIEGIKYVYHTWPMDDEETVNNFDRDYAYESKGDQVGGYPVGRSDRITIEAYSSGTRLLRLSSSISGITGNIDDKSELDAYMHSSVISDDGCVSFGLYYSDSGSKSHLTDHHQIYCVATENQRRWMEKLFDDLGEERLQSLKFSELILPGSHDSGMYTNQPVFQIASFANTQKDSIQNQLALGARIFDFRPGKLRDGWGDRFFSSEVKNKYVDFLRNIGINSGEVLESMFEGQKNTLRHIHNFVPGATCVEVVGQIADFLAENPKEIVVINAVSNGISEAVEIGTYSELRQIAEEELSRHSGLEVGDKHALKKTVAEIIDAGERLIIVGNKAVMGEDAIVTCGSYSNQYESKDSGNVVSACKKFNDRDLNGQDLAEYSLQLTATAADGAIFRILTSLTQSSSPLFATKAATDMLTYNWLLAGNLRRDHGDTLLAVYNDFYDPGLTAVISKILRERLL